MLSILVQPQYSSVGIMFSMKCFYKVLMQLLYKRKGETSRKQIRSVLIHLYI